MHDQTSRTGIDRRDGFLNRMKAKHPNIKIVSVQYGGGDQLKSTEITKSILQANPNLKGIFGANEGSAIGVLNGVKEMKQEDRRDRLRLRQAAEGGDRSTARWPAPSRRTRSASAQCTVDSAVKALKGEKLPKIIDTGFYWYDKTNIDRPEDRGGALRLRSVRPGGSPAAGPTPSFPG